jgi:hypothetical protein
MIARARRLLRSLVALGAALVLHLTLLVVVQRSDVHTLFPRRPRTAIDVALVPPPSTPPTTTPPTTTPPAETVRPAVRPAVRPRAAPPTTTPPPTTPTPLEATSSTPTPTPSVSTVPAPALPEGSGSLLRLPSSSSIDRVLGAGLSGGPSRATLEGALDLQVDGPLADSAAAAKRATRALQDDLADDAVSVGLADDYFRTLRERIETAWKPAVKQLNDGGKSTTQVGMMRSLVDDTGAWGELWQAYLDLAKQYGNGLQPRLEPARRERLRELMRSRRGAFRVQAITEARLTQDPSGRILLLELTLPSGHPGIDDGIKDAVAQALAAMPDEPPARVSHGRPFSSWWRLRATWTMVPPTAFLTGAGFDVTPRGFTVDVPFDIKLSTNVSLQRTDARTTATGDAR